MAKLLKIIMIHGHLPGVVELELDGHTNICGSNASGKTTLQRMIPVFYGELPNKVVPRTRLNFDKYYLPHKNSYVIYEYERPQNGVAQVVLTKRADGVDYRFIDAPYQPEHYLIEKKDTVVAREYNEWAQEMRARGVDMSAKISNTTEYRNIILNDIKNDRSNRSESLKHRQLASRYGLAHDKFHLRHMEKLVSAVHAKEGKMDTLKSMLAAILEEDGYQRPANTMTGDKIRSWLRDMKQFMKVEKLQQSLADIERNSAERSRNLAILWHLKGLIESDFSTQKRNKADTEEAIQSQKRAMTEAQEAYEQRRGSLRDKKNDAQADLDKSQRQLDEAQRQYDDYRDADIERIGRELEQLPERRDELQELEQHYRVMMEAHRGAEQELQAHKLKLTQQLEQAKEKIQTKINDKNQQQNRIRQHELDATKAMNQSLQHEQEKVRAQYDEQLEKLQGELAAKRAQQDLSMLNSEELEQRNLAELRLDKAQEHLEHQRQLTGKQQDALNTALRAREQADSKAKEARSAAAHGEQLIEQLRKRLEPAAGTLRQFLSQNVEHWQHSFGRVLAEPLLERSDLAPQLAAEPEQAEAESAANTVFGVQLDLHSIELPEYALTEARLQEQLEQAVEQWQRQKIQLEAAEKAFAKAVDEAKQQQQAFAQAQQQQKSFENDVAFARDHKQRLAHEHAQLDKARKKSIHERLEQLQQLVAQAKQQRQSALQELEQDHHARALEQTAEFQEQIQILQDAIDDLNSELARKQVSTKEQIKEAEQAFSAKLAEKGVDEKKLQHIKQKIGTLETHIRDTESQRDAFQSYQQFIKVTWENLRPQWLQTELQAKAALRDATAALERHEADYKAKRQTDSTELAKLKELLDKAEKHVQSLHSLANRMAELPVATQQPPADTVQGLEQGDVSERIARANQLLDDKQKADKRLEDALNALEAELRKDSDLDMVRFIDKSFADLGEAPDIQARVHKLAELVEVLEAKQHQILAQGRTIGTELEKFFTVFNDIHKRVSDYSRRLTHAVGDELQLDGIDKAEVKISSTIDELSFWQPLKDMTYEYRQWQASGEAIPPDNYLEHLSEVANLIKANQDYSIESLLKLQLNLIENGEPVVIRNDRQLTDSSSHGMAYLILCKFLLAFTRLLRPEQAGVTIHWPIDEIGTLAYHNVEKLFDACDHNHIDIVGAFPNPESDVLLLFKHRYLIEPHAELPNKGQLKRIKPRVSELSRKLQDLQRKPQEAQA